MDKFVINNVRKEKIDFLCNQDVYDIVNKTIEINETICLYGDSGVGKTFLVQNLLDNKKWVDLTHEVIKSNDFMERLKDTDCHVVIDDLESDVHLVKDIFENIKTGKKLSKGSLIIIARNTNKIDFCKGVFCEPIDIPTMITIARRQFPNETLVKLESLAKKSNGNIRNFLFSINFDEKRDIFKVPKEFISDLLCKHSSQDPREYIGQSIMEHGYIWDIVHENYIDADTDLDLVYISECMSQSDIIDTTIYNGNWELIPFFSTVSTIIPSIMINHSIKGPLRSGSAWTKFGNYKMRHLKYTSMSNRSTYNLDINTLMLIKTYCQTDKQKTLEIFKEYKLNSSDVDVINHLAVVSKLKPKEIQALKKVLKTYLGNV